MKEKVSKPSLSVLATLNPFPLRKLQTLTPLHHAAMAGRADNVRLLINAGAWVEGLSVGWSGCFVSFPFISFSSFLSLGPQDTDDVGKDQLAKQYLPIFSLFPLLDTNSSATSPLGCAGRAFELCETAR